MPTFGTLGSNVVPLYGGGQVPNPANVIVSSNAPSTNAVGNRVGTIWVVKSTGVAYLAVKNTGLSGSVTWDQIGLATGTVGSLTGNSGGAVLPTAGNINILGTANQITFAGAGSTLTASLIGPYTPATYTAHGVLLGEGTSSIVATAAGATGQVLKGATSADPAFGNISEFNIVDDTTGTIASPTSLVASTTYIADQAAVTNGFLLPASGSRGDVIKILGNGPGGWRIKQNASQQIVMSALSSTSGTGGSVSSGTKYDCVTLSCVVGGASTIWNISNSSGTLTFV